MARLLAFNAIFFLLPFAMYAGWLYVARGTAGNPAYWSVKTIGYLAFGGAICVVAGMLLFIHFSAAPAGSTYMPATVGEDGRIIPGRLE